MCEPWTVAKNKAPMVATPMALANCWAGIADLRMDHDVQQLHGRDALRLDLVGDPTQEPR